MRQVPPIWINGYNNNLLLLQTPDAVVFRLDGEPRSPETMIAQIQRYQAEYSYEDDDF